MCASSTWSQCHEHPLGDMIRADEQQAALLAYFRNNVLHLLALPALLACLVSHNQSLARQRAKEAIKGIYGLLRTDLFLPWDAADLDAAIDRSEAALVRRGLITGRGGRPACCAHRRPTARPVPNCGNWVKSFARRWSGSSSPWPCCSITAAASLTRAALEDATHLLAQRLAMLYEFNAAEFSEKLLFANVIRNLIDAEILQVDDTGLLQFDERVTLAAAQTELLLAADVRHSIQLVARAASSAST